MRRSDKQRFCGKETSRMLTRHIASVVAIQCGLQLINLWACEKLPESRLLKILSGLMLLMMAAEVFYFVFRILRSIRAVENKISQLSRKEDTDTAARLSEQNGTSELMEAIEILLEKESSANVMKKQAEINALQSQINPHFLYNTLETIRGQAICCGAVEIAEMAKALADIFRFNINKRGSMIFLYEEMDNIDAYMKIQKTRFRERFTLDKEIAPELMQMRIPKLLIQPLIENALKHGLELKREKGHIWVRAEQMEDMLLVTVADDGIGMSLTSLDQLNERIRLGTRGLSSAGKITNIGLSNINDRVKMIYGPKYGVTVRSVQNVGTRVTVSLGLQKPDEEEF